MFSAANIFDFQVAMTPEEMASKELQQWRQAELKHDIEKIKSHELQMISLGSVFVMKSHKGEQVSYYFEVLLSYIEVV
jgi:hypothetical protein